MRGICDTDEGDKINPPHRSVPLDRRVPGDCEGDRPIISSSWTKGQAERKEIKKPSEQY